MAEYENQTIEEIMLGDGNVFAVIGRVRRALQRSGCEKDYLDDFVSTAMGTFHSYEDVLNYCGDKLIEAGFRWGERSMTKEEELIQAIFSGENDGLTIQQLKEKLKIDTDGE